MMSPVASMSPSAAMQQVEEGYEEDNEELEPQVKQVVHKWPGGIAEYARLQMEKEDDEFMQQAYIQDLKKFKKHRVKIVANVADIWGDDLYEQ
jgi:hypothetical protein